MDNLKIFNAKDIDALISKRNGETKLGETIGLFNKIQDLHQSNAKYILLGIPEDIGVKANYGIGGTHTAWPAFLSAFLNVQANDFLPTEQVALLGEIMPPEGVNSSAESLRTIVEQIDNIVYPVIKYIVSAGKVPIIIGGGHNNSFPNLKGLSQAVNKAVNVINIDAHADIRPIEEGRHSGNGFSAALNEGFINKYCIFGLHQNYNNQYTLNQINNHPNISAVFFDNLLKDNLDIPTAWQDFTQNLYSPCALELDLDCISNVLSSAITPTGFSLNEIRKIILQNKIKFSYFHVCEGASKLDNGRNDAGIGKTISYLISDFIKNQSQLH